MGMVGADVYHAWDPDGMKYISMKPRIRPHLALHHQLIIRIQDLYMILNIAESLHFFVTLILMKFPGNRKPPKQFPYSSGSLSASPAPPTCQNYHLSASGCFLQGPRPARSGQRDTL